MKEPWKKQKITVRELIAFGRAQRACPAALAWLEKMRHKDADMPLGTLWRRCPRYDWMAWLVIRSLIMCPSPNWRDQRKGVMNLSEVENAVEDCSCSLCERLDPSAPLSVQLHWTDELREKCERHMAENFRKKYGFKKFQALVQQGYYQAELDRWHLGQKALVHGWKP